MLETAKKNVESSALVAFKVVNIQDIPYEDDTFQNGEESLGKHFSKAEKRTRKDGLAITHIPDFVDYVLSMSSLSGFKSAGAELLLQAFEKKCVNGTLYVPKEYGMFICR